MDVILIELPDLGGLFLTQAFFIAFDLLINVRGCFLDHACNFLDLFSELLIRLQELLTDTGTFLL